MRDPTQRTRSLSPTAAAIGLAGLLALPSSGQDPWADEVIEYVPGASPAWGFTDPATTLGEPTRFTGNVFSSGVVSPFFPAFGTDEVVSIGAGGHLIVSFDEPVLDDPRNPHGLDLIVFGNAGMIDASYPDGYASGGLFGADGGLVDVSQDGLIWHVVPDVLADGSMPTIGWRDAGPYDQEPGDLPTSFVRPVPPGLVPADFAGMTTAQIVDTYALSGGGRAIDLAVVGLEWIAYVRVRNPSGALEHVEIDAFADVSPRGDADEDGIVSVGDLLLVIAEWGATGPHGSLADFDGDGVVDTDDLLIVIANWED